MSFTNRDYMATAKIISEQKEIAESTGDDEQAQAVLDNLAESFAAWFSENPRFNRERFLRDCGVKP